MKKSVILSLVLSLVVFTGGFANSIKDTSDVKLANALNIKRAPQTFSSAEQEFLSELDNYYYQTFEKPAEDLTNGIEEESYKNVVVYSLYGEVLTTDKAKIPTNADVLMTEGETIYYIVY